MNIVQAARLQHQNREEDSNAEENRIQFVCQRLEETLVKKEKLRVSAQNVKLLQQKLKLSQPLLPIRKHSKNYDSS